MFSNKVEFRSTPIFAARQQKTYLGGEGHPWQGSPCPASRPALASPVRTQRQHPPEVPRSRSQPGGLEKSAPELWGSREILPLCPLFGFVLFPCHQFSKEGSLQAHKGSGLAWTPWELLVSPFLFPALTSQVLTFHRLLACCFLKFSKLTTDSLLTMAWWLFMGWRQEATRSPCSCNMLDTLNILYKIIVVPFPCPNSPTDSNILPRFRDINLG